MKRRKIWVAVMAVALAFILLFMAGVVQYMTTIITIIGGEESQTSSEDISLEGLPPFITVEMVEALIEMQDTYGHPASTGLAQIIVESGFGNYGPGGESGQGLSKLAYNQKNLFGIKYFSGDSFATGSYSYSTGEQTATGGNYVIVAGFSVYPNYTACIKQRSWMLERSPYISHIAAYKKTGNNYTPSQADGFISGIRAGGWATSIQYVQHCTAVMQKYNLYRFDNMSLDQLHRLQNGAGIAQTGGGQEYNSATAAQKRIVDVAKQTRFAGDGLCATWVSRVFANAGQPYPYGNANSFTMTRASGGIKVGMVICVQHSGPRPSSYKYGHIGIYIGDGKVFHNESSRTGNQGNGCTITDLENWKATYEYQCTAYYGWVNGIDLSR